MSLHLGVVSIRGNHLSDIPHLFEQFNYRLAGKPKSCSTVEELTDELKEVMMDNRTKVKKVVYFENGWTHILDFEQVLITGEDVWSSASKNWSEPVLCWVCEGTSNVYMFSLFRAGQKIRSVDYVDGELSEFGEALPEEEGIDWAQTFETEILEIAERLGAPYGYLEANTEYQVYLLDESHLLPGKS